MSFLSGNLSIHKLYHRSGNSGEVIVITENYSLNYQGPKQIILSLKEHLDGRVFYGNFMSHYNEI